MHEWHSLEWGFSFLSEPVISWISLSHSHKAMFTSLYSKKWKPLILLHCTPCTSKECSMSLSLEMFLNSTDVGQLVKDLLKAYILLWGTGWDTLQLSPTLCFIRPHRMCIPTFSHSNTEHAASHTETLTSEQWQILSSPSQSNDTPSWDWDIQLLYQQ